ncbi:phosphatase PAP2 family protein [Glaciihabitans sp. UYNi722]|uniref:phosphatase PAP2 family protein n=1 Tax=Glaciihabitans sp. UYNi722 TaxID=3156344 RepID=UPI003396315B
MKSQPKILTSTTPISRLLIVALITVAIVVAAGFAFRALGNFEMPLSHALNALHHGALGTLGNVLYHDVGPVPAVLATIVLTGIILLVNRDLRVASTFAVTIAATWLSVVAVKVIVDRPRPDAALLPFPFHPIQVDASYPSGHATFITALVVVLVAMIASGRVRTIAIAIGALIVASAGFLLAVDGVHYTTDVLASIVWVLGVAPLVRGLWVRVALPRLPFLTPRGSRTSSIVNQVTPPAGR